MKRKLLKKKYIMLICWAALLCSAEAGEVNWATLIPAFADATFVEDKQVCVECHEASVTAYSHTTHGRIFQYGAKGALQALDCEACHGPRSKHISSPDADLHLSAEQYMEICLQCHQDGGRMHWQTSPHNSGDVSCASCHTIMHKKSEKALLSKTDEQTVCYSCHADVRGQMQKSYHHPVREKRMSCSSCHDPHGSIGKDMLKGATVNEVCFKCHQEKRGPFIWEHPVVRENCANCHDAHGSNNRDLLNAKGSFLCMQCHAYGGHPNLPRYNRVSNQYSQGCVNCHITQHGSNHPSGAKFTR